MRAVFIGTAITIAAFVPVSGAAAAAAAAQRGSTRLSGKLVWILGGFGRDGQVTLSA
jgi:hypothetical protein